MQENKSWDFTEVEILFAMPFADLILEAQKVHRENFNANEVRISTLLSVKTGSCGGDCAYCPQSAHYKSGLNKGSFLALDSVVVAAKKAKAMGASHFCVSASGSTPKENEFVQYLAMIKEIKNGILAIHDIFPDPSKGGQAPFEIWKLALASGLFEKLELVDTLGFLRRL